MSVSTSQLAGKLKEREFNRKCLVGNSADKNNDYQGIPIVYHSNALTVGQDANGTPYILAIDGSQIPAGYNDTILLLDRHWRELIHAGFVTNAEPYSQKQRHIIIPTHERGVYGTTVSTASYGVTSCGYDFRITNQARQLKADIEVLDPKANQDAVWESVPAYVDESGEYFIIPANAFILGVTQEWFHIPRNCVVQCTGKSTIARSGLVVTVTPWEPAWQGYVTVEISNTSTKPVKLYIGEGVGQALMTVIGSYGPDVSYADKGGKYQNQAATVAYSKY